MADDPILVIHGVANRDEAAFATTVRHLAQDAGRDPDSLVGVFWGDLGARADGIADTIPGAVAAAVRAVVGTADPDARWAVEALLEAPVDGDASGSAVRGATDEPRRAAVAASGFEERSGVAAGDAVAEAFLESSYLTAFADDAVLRELGVAVAEAVDVPPSADAEAVRGLGDLHLKQRIVQAVHAIDRAVGAALDAVGGQVNTHLRTAYGPKVAEFLGDVIVYHAHRDAIQARVREVLRRDLPGYGTPERPITVLGHSLGGVIAFDLAVSVREPLSIRRLVTFGSQSAMFHVMDPRTPNVAPFVPPSPSALPATIGAWTNLWEPRDPLAFIAAKVFVLASGTPPVDRAVTSPASLGLWTHSSYWTLPELAAIVHDEAP